MRKIKCTEDRICYMTPAEENGKEMGSDIPDDLMPLSSVKSSVGASPKRRRRKRANKVLIGGRKLKRINRRPGSKPVRRRRKPAAPKRRKTVKRSKTVRRKRR